MEHRHSELTAQSLISKLCGATEKSCWVQKVTWMAVWLATDVILYPSWHIPEKHTDHFLRSHSWRKLLQIQMD